MEDYRFYYDESSHSRRITENTVLSENFDSNFIGVIVGYNSNIEKDVLNKYLCFEDKHKIIREIQGELKSQTIRQDKLQYGFKSLHDNDYMLLDDYFDFVIDQNLNIYYAVINKMEYIINQLFTPAQCPFWINYNAAVYTLSKVIMVNKDDELIHSIYKNDGTFINTFKTFLKNILELNKGIEHKSFENSALSILLSCVNKMKDDFVIDWNYEISFQGFKSYLEENKIDKYLLFTDREGSGKTIRAAKKVVSPTAKEVDSSEVEGVRIADMLAGIICKILKSLENEYKYDCIEDRINRKYLSEEWFDIDEKTLNLYKKFYYIMIEQHQCYYKSYSGRNSDMLICLISLLRYFNNYCNIDDYSKISCEDHVNKFNSNFMLTLSGYYDDYFD